MATMIKTDMGRSAARVRMRKENPVPVVAKEWKVIHGQRVLVKVYKQMACEGYLVWPAVVWAGKRRLP